MSDCEASEKFALRERKRMVRWLWCKASAGACNKLYPSFFWSQNSPFKLVSWSNTAKSPGCGRQGHVSQLGSNFESPYKLHSIKKTHFGRTFSLERSFLACIRKSTVQVSPFLPIKALGILGKSHQAGVEAIWLPSQDNIHFTFFAFSSVSTASSPSSITFRQISNPLSCTPAERTH